PERAPLPADALAAIRALPGTASVVADSTVPLEWDGVPIEAHGWSAAPLTPYEIRDGRIPRSASEVVVDGNLASRTKLGEPITLAHGGIDRDYRVGGIGAAASHDQPARAEHVFLTGAAASALAPRDGAAEVVGVFARDGVSPSDLAGEIRV